MDKKEKSFDKEESFFEKEDMVSPFEKKEAEVTVVQPKTSSPKKPYRVINLFYGDFILEDSRGCGLRIPIPKEYKDAKIGDTIYL